VFLLKQELAVTVVEAVPLTLPLNKTLFDAPLLTVSTLQLNVPFVVLPLERMTELLAVDVLAQKSIVAVLKNVP
jgi:hypothetical protein